MAKETIRPIRKRYSHAKADAKLAAKRKKAELLKVARSCRSDEEQIALLDVGGYAAKKERARLLKS